MTDNLIQKIEEKVVILLDELESLRAAARQLRQENSALRLEQNGYANKLQSLIALLNVVEKPLLEKESM